MNRAKRQPHQKQLYSYILLDCFALQAIIPAGCMPAAITDESNSFLQICGSNFQLTAIKQSVDEQSHHHHQTHTDDSLSSDDGDHDSHHSQFSNHILCPFNLLGTDASLLSKIFIQNTSEQIANIESQYTTQEFSRTLNTNHSPRAPPIFA